jgi:hypothetical protein
VVEPGPLAVNVTEEVLRIVVRLVELLEAVNVTVPLNPLTPATVMLVELLDPAGTVRFGFAELILKSTPTTVTVVDAERLEAVAVTLMTAFPVRVLVWIVRVAFCLLPGVSVSVVGVIEVTKPQAQPVAVAESVTVPPKFPRLVTVIVEFADEEAGIVRLCGVALTVNP